MLALVPTFGKVAPFGWFIGLRVAPSRTTSSPGRPLAEAPGDSLSVCRKADFMNHPLPYEVNCSILFTELPLLQRPGP
ncbi:hypothetical protein I552_2951 [Mycobacterium xenopi 3993]|nr:hypothetical protein I552_2951 [Mycobacterium xenopi 3993]